MLKNPTKLVDTLGLKPCFQDADAEKYAEGIIKKHGGVKVKDGHYRFPNRRSAKQAASEIAGDLGIDPQKTRKKDYWGGPKSWKDSDTVIGKKSRDGTSGWRDDSPGHFFGKNHPDNAGPHVNAWNESKGVHDNLHLLY